MKIAVLGCGVIGLSTAILLQREGFDVTIYAKEFPPYICSNAAGAVWLPLLVGKESHVPKDYVHQLEKWATATWKELNDLKNFNSGIKPVQSHELFADVSHPLPFLLKIFNDFSAQPDSSLPKGYTYRWSFTTFLIEPDIYMDFLLKTFLDNGGACLQKEYTSRQEVLTADEKVIFNCLGLGANSICNDPDLKGVKGQLLFHDPVDLGYAIGAGEFVILPRSDALVLGSLFQESFETIDATKENDDLLWSTISQWETATEGHIGIPKGTLCKEKIRGNLAAIRPYRATGIRLEREDSGDKCLIHNYGHGGSGLTLSWGCAEEAIALANDALLAGQQV